MSKLDEIEAQIRPYEGVSGLEKEQAELLIRAVRQLGAVQRAFDAVKHEIDEGRPQYVNEGLQYVFEALGRVDPDVKELINE